VIVLAGTLDDLRGLGDHSKFLAQIAAAGLMLFWGGEHLRSLGNLVGAWPLGRLFDSAVVRGRGGGHQCGQLHRRRRRACRRVADAFGRIQRIGLSDGGAEVACNPIIVWPKLLINPSCVCP